MPLRHPPFKDFDEELEAANRVLQVRDGKQGEIDEHSAACSTKGPLYRSLNLRDTIADNAEARVALRAQAVRGKLFGFCAAGFWAMRRFRIGQWLADEVTISARFSHDTERQVYEGS